uniref:ORF106 n=1 Tax=Malaco herpesvirus 1 TaxID=3031797 RepID=A0AA48P853_9VIRU|nr:TPA_asm: ORF106 [Malaco herpesvirus 1]
MRTWPDLYKYRPNTLVGTHSSPYHHTSNNYSEMEAAAPYLAAFCAETDQVRDRLKALLVHCKIVPDEPTESRKRTLVPDEVIVIDDDDEVIVIDDEPEPESEPVTKKMRVEHEPVPEPVPEKMRVEHEPAPQTLKEKMIEAMTDESTTLWEKAHVLLRIAHEPYRSTMPVLPKLVWKKSLTSRAGQYWPAKHLIDLSYGLVTDVSTLVCTLYHELAHAVVDTGYDATLVNKNGPHGSIWKWECRKMEALFGNTFTLSTYHTRKLQYDYTYECLRCSRQQKTKKPIRKMTCVCTDSNTFVPYRRTVVNNTKYVHFYTRDNIPRYPFTN